MLVKTDISNHAIAAADSTSSPPRQPRAASPHQAQQRPIDQPLSALDEDLLARWFDPIDRLERYAMEKYSMNLWRLRQWSEQPHIDQALLKMEAFVAKHARAAAAAAFHLATKALSDVARDPVNAPRDRRLAAMQLHRAALKVLSAAPSPHDAGDDSAPEPDASPASRRSYSSNADDPDQPNQTAPTPPHPLHRPRSTPIHLSKPQPPRPRAVNRPSSARPAPTTNNKTSRANPSRSATPPNRQNHRSN